MVVKWSYALANAAPVLVGTWRLGKSHLLPTSTVHMQPIRRVSTPTCGMTMKFAGQSYPSVAPRTLSHLSPVMGKEDDIQLSLVAQGKKPREVLVGRTWRIWVRNSSSSSNDVLSVMLYNRRKPSPLLIHWLRKACRVLSISAQLKQAPGDYRKVGPTQQSSGAYAEFFLASGVEHVEHAGVAVDDHLPSVARLDRWATNQGSHPTRAEKEKKVGGRGGGVVVKDIRIVVLHEMGRAHLYSEGCVDLEGG